MRATSTFSIRQCAPFALKSLATLRKPIAMIAAVGTQAHFKYNLFHASHIPP
jgi:hypothetical protein